MDLLATPPGRPQGTSRARRNSSSPTRGHNESTLESFDRDALVQLVLHGQNAREELQFKLARLVETRQTIAEEHDHDLAELGRQLQGARVRLDELLAQQGNMDEELSGRVQVVEVLRTSIREAEREKRDAEKRYREQTESFDSERQSWYDEEQHYKLRITNLSSAPRKARLSDLSTKLAKTNDDPPSPSRVTPTLLTSPSGTRAASPSITSTPSPNEVVLQQQLESLTVAHDSLLATSRALQSEISELKRLFHDLQAENESYELLLGERTLNGELRGSNLFRRSWIEDDGNGYGSGARDQGLESVGETEEKEVDDEESSSDGGELGSTSSTVQLSSSPEIERPAKTQPKKRPSGGLDLAAEMEAAQFGDEEEQETPRAERKKKLKHHKSSAVLEGESLKAELKSLREANKALTLYVSKIVDRVCSQEGFEKVLAVDYRLTPKTTDHSSNPPYQRVLPPVPVEAPAPPPVVNKSMFRGNSISAASIPPRPDQSTTQLSAPSGPPLSSATNRRTSRRPMSLDWGSVTSVFSSALPSSAPTPSASAQSTSNPTSGLKPMLLDPTAPTGASRRISMEDDEDDRERERLRAELALLGLDDSRNSTATKMGATVGWGGPGSRRSVSGPPSQGGASLGVLSATTGLPRSNRSSYTKPTPPDITAHPPSPPVPEPRDLDALYFEQKQTSELAIKALAMQEKQAKIELENGRASGFTEIQFRRHRPGSGSVRSGSSASNGSSGRQSRAGTTTTDVLPESAPRTSTTLSPESSPDLSRHATTSPLDRSPLLKGGEYATVSTAGWSSADTTPQLGGAVEESEPDPSLGVGWGQRMKRMSLSPWSSATPPPPSAPSMP